MISDWSSSGCMVDGVPTLQCFEVIFSNILLMASSFIVLTLFIMLVVGAFNYLSSFGNPEKVKKAQGTIKFAIIGFVLFMASFLILKIIDFLFLGNNNTIFKFELPGA